MQVDVFAAKPLGGNPLAVFVNPPPVETERMQAWAREMNLSETTFAWVDTPQRYRVRIFTPAHELPFAGHPTLGTAAVLHTLGLIEDRVIQVSASGETECWRDERGVWWLAPTEGRVGPVVSPTAASEALGVPLGWISDDRPPQIMWAGLTFLLVNIPAAQIPELDPPFSRMRTILESLPDKPGGLYVWAPDGPGKIRARGFAPGYGVNEDPATGSAVADLGWYLVGAAGVTEPVAYRVRQGAEVGRPSEVHLALNLGPTRRVQVGGQVLLVFQARIENL